jgi:hypothetical protein
MSSRLTDGAQRRMARVAKRVHAQHNVPGEDATSLRNKLFSVGLPADYYDSLFNTVRLWERASAQRDAAQRAVAAEATESRAAAAEIVRLVNVIRNQAKNTRYFKTEIAASAAATFVPVQDIDSQMDAEATLRQFGESLAARFNPADLRLPVDIVALSNAALAAYEKESAETMQAGSTLEFRAAAARYQIDQLQFLFQMVLAMKEAWEEQSGEALTGFGWNELRETSSQFDAGTLPADGDEGADEGDSDADTTPATANEAGTEPTDETGPVPGF